MLQEFFEPGAELEGEEEEGADEEYEREGWILEDEEAVGFDEYGDGEEEEENGDEGGDEQAEEIHDGGVGEGHDPQAGKKNGHDGGIEEAASGGWMIGGEAFEGAVGETMGGVADGKEDAGEGGDERAQADEGAEVGHGVGDAGFGAQEGKAIEVFGGGAFEFRGFEGKDAGEDEEEDEGEQQGGGFQDGAAEAAVGVQGIVVAGGTVGGGHGGHGGEKHEGKGEERENEEDVVEKFGGRRDLAEQGEIPEGKQIEGYAEQDDEEDGRDGAHQAHDDLVAEGMEGGEGGQNDQAEEGAMGPIGGGGVHLEEESAEVGVEADGIGEKDDVEREEKRNGDAQAERWAEAAGDDAGIIKGIRIQQKHGDDGFVGKIDEGKHEGGQKDERPEAPGADLEGEIEDAGADGGAEEGQYPAPFGEFLRGVRTWGIRRWGMGGHGWGRYQSVPDWGILFGAG